MAISTASNRAAGSSGRASATRADVADPPVDAGFQDDRYSLAWTGGEIYRPGTSSMAMFGSNTTTPQPPTLRTQGRLLGTQIHLRPCQHRRAMANIDSFEPGTNNHPRGQGNIPKPQNPPWRSSVGGARLGVPAVDQCWAWQKMPNSPILLT
jgi:hypothetical protein